MSTVPNTAVVVPRQLTQAEYARLGSDVFQEINHRLAPGVLSPESYKRVQGEINRTNPEAAKDVVAMLFTNYNAAIELMVNLHLQIIRSKMFEPGFLSWVKEPPAVIQRRQLERGEKPLTDDQGRAQITAATEKAKEAAEFDKQEKKYEKDVSVLIDKIFFINPRSQQRDERKIQDLQQELHDVVAKARRNGKTWGELHAVVARRINAEYAADEKAREKWNSR